MRDQPAKVQGTNGEGEYYYFLDGLRGVAAVLVALYHISIAVQKPLVPAGFLAVDFFFVLSGFVVAHAYHLRLTEKMTIRQFISRRMERLYPLFFLGMGFSLLDALLSKLIGLSETNWKTSLLSFLFSILFLPTPPLSSQIRGVFPLNGPAWSLSLEFWTNAGYAFLTRKRLELLFWILPSISLVALMIGIKYFGSANIGWSWADYWGGWTRVIFSFFIGVLIFKMIDFIGAKIGEIVMPFSTTIAILCTFVLIGTFIFAKSASRQLFSIFVIFPFIVIIGSQIVLQVQATKIFKIFGAISYPLYITHHAVFGLLNTACNLAGLELFASHVSIRIFVWIAAAILFSVLANYFYDEPIRRVLAARRRVKTAAERL